MGIPRFVNLVDILFPNIVRYVNLVYIHIAMFTLRHILRLNALSCLVFGLVFAIRPAYVTEFLANADTAPAELILGIGIVLLINAAHLIWASFADQPIRKLIIYFALGDFLWVIASIGLVHMKLWITTSGGIFATLLVAVMVGLFGILQIVKLPNR